VSAPDWSDPRLVAAAAAYVPPAPYLRSDGVEVCCHTIPVAAGSCPDCWDLVKWDVADAIRAEGDSA